MELGARIRSLREKQKLTVAHCAEIVGVSLSTYRDWEQGRSITGEPYIKIAEALNTSLAEVLGLSKSQALFEIEQIERLAENLLKSIKVTKAHL